MIKQKSEYTLNKSTTWQLFTANGHILHILIANRRFLRKKMGEELRTIFTDESVSLQSGGNINLKTDITILYSFSYNFVYLYSFN